MAQHDQACILSGRNCPLRSIEMNTWEYYRSQVCFSELKGKTLTKIEGMEVDCSLVKFSCSDGSEYLMYHDQDCCESVGINDVEGDVSDIIGLPVVIAEEVSSEDYPAPSGDYVESYTWTFYRISTQKGMVVLRWLGESNGYYSESVSFAKIS